MCFCEQRFGAYFLSFFCLGVKNRFVGISPDTVEFSCYSFWCSRGMINFVVTFTHFQPQVSLTLTHLQGHGKGVHGEEKQQPCNERDIFFFVSNVRSGLTELFAPVVVLNDRVTIITKKR